MDLQQIEDDLHSSGDESRSDIAEDDFLQEKSDVVKALRLAKEASLSDARDIAEATLHANPANAPALFVNAAECESRQDWSEAARFFLVGLGHNSSDASMEQGFQTNVDMLRGQRRRLVERPASNKWEDVLSFKPKAAADRPPSPDDKPPWYRLGPVFEEILAEPCCYIRDLLEQQQDAEHEAMEVRRVIYENLGYLNQLFAYYKQDLNQSQSAEEIIENQVEHDGHDPCDEEEPMPLYCFWRILKECKIAMGNVKVKMPVAVFDRVHVQGKRRTARMQQDASFDMTAIDPHDRNLPVVFYDLVETLIRIGMLKLQGTLSNRFEGLIKDFLRPFAMRKQVEKGYLEFRTEEVQQVCADAFIAEKSRKVFEYYIRIYKANKVRQGMVGPNDITMSFNHVHSVIEKTESFDPNFGEKKLMECFCKITCDSDLLPQEHPNNQNSEMVYDEFLDIILRVARAKKYPGATPEECLRGFMVNKIFYETNKMMPGKL